MILERINNPQDLKKIPVAELGALAGEIRQRIVSVVAKTGGHLASSLGAVELAIALHYCLDTPRDIIIWDVGHQAYAHKILTGRNKDFDKIRQWKGISGFPSAAESVFDPFTMGHSSTSVSLALGMAAARDLQKGREKIVAVIGDGSLSGGMCFEALNQVGHIKTNVMVVLNTNEMSISPNVGALSTYMNKIISLPVYNRVKYAIENFMKLRIPRIGPRLTKVADRFEEVLKGLIVPGIFFEELGFRYFGPFDGHDIEGLIANLKNIIQIDCPVLFHVVTRKGKGYAPAEREPERFHSASQFDMTTGAAHASAEPEETYTSVFGKHLVKLAQENPRVIAITAAMTNGTGLDAFAAAFPTRLFDVGIAEQHAVTFAAGMAKGGFHPVVAIYSTFLQRAYDQIIVDVCLQNLGVVFCIDRAGIVGPDGPTHQGAFDLVYLCNLPNMAVMAPANAKEFTMMLDFAVAYGRPIALRYPKAHARAAASEPLPIVLGKAEVLAEGNTVALVALGSMVEVAAEVHALLSKKHIRATLVNARFAKPIDSALFEKLAKNHSFIFTFEEGSVEGGFGSAVAAHLEHLNLRNGLVLRAKRFGLPCEFITFAKRAQLFDICGLSAPHLTQQIINCMNQRP